MNLRPIIPLIIFMLLTPCALATAGHEYVVVVHKDNQIDSLHAAEVKRIFLGKQKRWSDGSPIRVVLNPKDESHAQFSHALLHKSPNQLEVYWRKQLFGGRSMMPHKAQSKDDLTSYLVRNKNSISYLSKDDLAGPVKVLRIVR